MRVAFLSGYDAAGQRFNGLVLHRALLAAGYKSDYAVAERSLSEPHIHQLGGRWLRQANRVTVKLEQKLSRQSDLAVLGTAFLNAPYVRRADLIHLQLLHAKSFFSLRHLPQLANGRRPVLWTLHDPWITTGHCVHPFDCNRWQTGCGHCPDLSLPLAITRDRTAANWALKKRVMARSRVHLIVASRWMEERVAESPLLAGLPCSLIPFGIDTTLFRPQPKPQARASLGIPADARAVAVRWAPHNIFKGTQFADAALASLPAGMVTDVICFDSAGGSDVAALRQRFRVTTINSHLDQQAIATGLAAADLFLMPSTAESFGMMAVEAMACGTPPVVFTGTALPDVIDAPRGGIAVPAGDAAELSRAIVGMLTNDSLRDSCRQHGLQLARSRYDKQRYIDEHLLLYKHLLDATRHSGSPSRQNRPAADSMPTP